MCVHVGVPDVTVSKLSVSVSVGVGLLSVFALVSSAALASQRAERNNHIQDAKMQRGVSVS